MTINSLSTGSAGNLDPAAMRARLFERADTDGSGGLSKDELTTAMKHRPAPPQGPPPGEAVLNADSLFATLDADGSGEVSAQEHEEGLAALQRERESRTETLSAESQDLLKALMEALEAKDGETEVDGETLQAVLKALVTSLKQGQPYDATGAREAETRGAALDTIA